MAEMLLAIAPIFLLILLGHALRRGGIPSLEFWNLNDKLVYWVLFPALLFYKMATLELTGSQVGEFALVIYGGFAAAMLFALLSGRLVRLDAPLWTSVVQGCTRHNTFIALAVAERVYGVEGLVFAAVITALLIPVTNVSVVATMVLLLRGRAEGSVFTAILKDLARNPLLIAVLLGIVVNASGISNIPILFDMAKILGAAALPIVLLCVGANIRIRAMVYATMATVLSIAGKMIVFPFVIGCIAIGVGLDQQATLVAMVFGAVPSAASAYTLARQMGGDAPAMAAIVTIQTALSFLSLPLTLWVVEAWLS